MGLLLASILLAAPKYKLVWSDEFNKPGKPDPTSWGYEVGFVRNQELQWYQPENVRCEKGKLIIEALRETIPNPNFQEGSKDWKRNRKTAEYTSGCIKTAGKRTWLYGRFEIRARIVTQDGLWPAIWTLGEKGPWPSNGEIDLLEFYQNTILANTAYGVRGGTWNTVKTPIQHFFDKDPKWSSKFHTWRMDWDENFIKIYLDGELLHTTDVSKTVNPDGRNPFHQPHYLLLNLAIGSTGGDPSHTKFPTKYEIDYVRVYQQVK